MEADFRFGWSRWLDRTSPTRQRQAPPRWRLWPVQMTGFMLPWWEAPGLVHPPLSSILAVSMTAGGRAHWTAGLGLRQAVSRLTQGASPRIRGVWTRPARAGGRSLALWLAYQLLLLHLHLLLFLPPLLLLFLFSPHLPQSTVVLPPPPALVPPGLVVLVRPGGIVRSIKSPTCSDCGMTPPGVCSRPCPWGNLAPKKAHLSWAGTAGAVGMEGVVRDKGWATAPQDPGLSIRPWCSAPTPGAVRGRPLWTARGGPHRDPRWCPEAWFVEKHRYWQSYTLSILQ